MNESISLQLRQVREARSLSLEQVSQATRIRLHYLKAIESGDFNVLPSQAQARGFIRSYASYLGMDAEAFLAALAEERPLTMQVKTSPPKVEAPVLNLEQADGIFTEIGDRLRTQRELLDLTLEDVERHTHIRHHYLEALEAGRIAGLPSPVQGRGMLNNYASFLGMDTEPLLLQYAEGLQAGLVARQQLTPPISQSRWRRTGSSRSGPESKLRRILSGDFLVGGVLSALLIVFVLWGFTRISDIRGDQLQSSPTPSARPISEVLMGAPTHTAIVTPASGTTAAQPTASGQAAVETISTGEAGLEVIPLLPADAQPTSPFIPPAPGTAPVQIHIVVSQRAWIRITVDEKVAFEGRVTSGSAYSYYGDRRVEVMTSNGAAIQVYYNQLDLGAMGMFGEVVQRIYTAQEIQTPTASVTPTGMVPPTSTPGPTETPTQTGTITPTAATPAATATPSP